MKSTKLSPRRSCDTEGMGRPANYCSTMLGKDQPLGSIDRAKMNIKGSSLAYGHPFAATGGRIIAVLAKILEENGGGRGLISICTAGGMGVCAIMERPEAASNLQPQFLR